MMFSFNIEDYSTLFGQSELSSNKNVIIIINSMFFFQAPSIV